MKLLDAFTLYRRNEILALGKSDKTNESYIYAAKKAIGYFGNINIENIDVDMVHEYYLWNCNDCSKNTARLYVCQLRTILGYFMKRGYKTLSVDDIRTPKREKKEAKFITCEEFDLFLSRLERAHRGYSHLNRIRNALIARMLFETGLRISELCALDRDSIRDRAFCVVGKSKDPRPCYITKDLEANLNNYLAMRNDNCKALFIANQTGKRITAGTVRDVFRRASKNAPGPLITPHVLRHSFATRLIEDGVDIRFVAALLGHQSLETTQRYTHIRDAKLRQVYEGVMGH